MGIEEQAKVEVGQIVKLSIPHFKREDRKKDDRYYLVFQINETDHTLTNITGRDKRENVNPIPQYPISKEIDPEIKSFVNSNTKIFIEHKLFFELFEGLPQENKDKQLLPKLSEEEVNEIRKSVDDCFNDERFRGNRYEVRVK